MILLRHVCVRFLCKRYVYHFNLLTCCYLFHRHCRQSPAVYPHIAQGILSRYNWLIIGHLLWYLRGWRIVKVNMLASSKLNNLLITTTFSYKFALLSDIGNDNLKAIFQQDFSYNCADNCLWSTLATNISLQRLLWYLTAAHQKLTFEISTWHECQMLKISYSIFDLDFTMLHWTISRASKGNTVLDTLAGRYDHSARYRHRVSPE